MGDFIFIFTIVLCILIYYFKKHNKEQTEIPKKQTEIPKKQAEIPKKQAEIQKEQEFNQEIESLQIKMEPLAEKIAELLSEHMSKNHLSLDELKKVDLSTHLWASFEFDVKGLSYDTTHPSWHYAEIGYEIVFEDRDKKLLALQKEFVKFLGDNWMVDYSTETKTYSYDTDRYTASTDYSGKVIIQKEKGVGSYERVTSRIIKKADYQKEKKKKNEKIVL